MGKKVFKDNKLVFNQIVHNLKNKYYNLYRSNFKAIEGLDYIQEKYIFDKFWGTGTVACFLIKPIDELGFAPWVLNSWNMYGMPETITLVNERGSVLIPSKPLVVDKDVVIGYIQPNQKPLSLLVDWYIERIAQVEMVINTNLQIHKMPFLIPVEDDAAKKKVSDLVDRILNDELVIYLDGIDPNIFKAVATSAPYIIDKLQNYKKDLENDLKTILGVNNNGTNKIEQLQLAEVNSNNAEINSFNNCYEDELNKFGDRIKETFGKTVKFKCVAERAVLDGEQHNMTEQPGPKEGDAENE